MWAVVVLGILTAVFAWVWFGGKGEKREPETRDSVQDSQSRSNVESETQASEDSDASIPGAQDVSQGNASQAGEGSESAELTAKVIPPNFSEKAPCQVLHLRNASESGKVLVTDAKVEEDIADIQAVDLKPSSVADYEPVQASKHQDCHHLAQDKLQIGVELLETSKTTTQELQCTKVYNHVIVSAKKTAQDCEADGKPKAATDDKVANNETVNSSIDSVSHEVNDLKASFTSDQLATENKVNDQVVLSSIVADSQAGSELKAPCASDQPLTASDDTVVNDQDVHSPTVPDLQVVNDLKAQFTSGQPLPAAENDWDAHPLSIVGTQELSDLKTSFTSGQHPTAAENKVESDDVHPSIVAGTQEASVLTSCTSCQPLTATDNLVNEEVHPCIVKAAEGVTVDDLATFTTTDMPRSSESKQVHDHEESNISESTTEEVKAPEDHVKPCNGTIEDHLVQTREEVVQLNAGHGNLCANVQEFLKIDGDLVNHSTFLENVEANGKQVCSTHSSEKTNLLEEVIHTTDVPDAVELRNRGEETQMCVQEENVVAFLQEYSKDSGVLSSAGAVEGAAMKDCRPHEKFTDSASPVAVLSSKEDVPEEHACGKSEACERSHIDFSVNDLLATEEATTNSLPVTITDDPSTETDIVAHKDLHDELSNTQLLEDVVLPASHTHLSDDKGAPPLNTFTEEYPDFKESSSGEKSSDAGHTEAKHQDDAQKTKRVAAVHPMPQAVNLGFKVHYITNSDDQIIAITGDHEKLGGWEVCVPLNPDKDGFWSNSIAFPVDASLEWKFVVLENGKVKRWEECDNRCIRTTHEDVIAQQWWGYP